MNDVPRRDVLRWAAAAPLLLLRRPRPQRWLTVPAGFRGGFRSGFAEQRVRVA